MKEASYHLIPEIKKWMSQESNPSEQARYAVALFITLGRKLGKFFIWLTEPSMSNASLMIRFIHVSPFFGVKMYQPLAPWSQAFLTSEYVAALTVSGWHIYG